MADTATLENRDAMGMQTVSQTGQVPKSCVPDATDAVTIVNSIIEANKERLQEEMPVKGMLNGNPPYESSKLKRAGLDWMANFSTREGPAISTMAKTPFYDLFGATRTTMDVQTEWGNAEDRKAISRIISDELQTLITRYTSWHVNIWSMISDFVDFGRGFLTWNGPDTYKFKRVLHNKVQVTNGTSTDLDELEVILILQEVSAKALWRMSDSGKAVGWNEKSVVEAVSKAAPESITTGQDPFDVVRRMAEHDLATSVRIPSVELGHLYVREFNGKWSHIVVNAKFTSDKKTETGATAELYRSIGLYQKVQEFLCPFFFEVGEGSWNGLKGLGHQIHPHMRVSDRLLCKGVSGAFIRSGIVLQPLTEAARNRIPVVQVGNVTVLPPGYTVQQATVMTDLESTTAMRRELGNIVAGNTGVFRPQVEKSQGNPPTAFEFNARLQQAISLSSSAVDRFYDQADVFCEEFYRRVLKAAKNGDEEAKGFVERCKAKGVPQEALEKTRWVKAVRVAGSGSNTVRQQLYLTFAQLILPMLPEDGRQNFIEATIAAFFDQNTVESWYPTDAKKKLPGDDEAFATLENSSLAHGGGAVRTPHQNDVVHAQTHLVGASQAAAGLQQGADPEQVLGAINAIGQHTAFHMQALAGDPTRKSVFKLLSQQFEELGKTVKNLQGIVASNQQQMAEQQQKMAEAQAIQQGTDPDMQIKAAKTAKTMELQTAKTQHGMALKTAKAQQDMALADATTAAEIRRQEQKAQAQTKTEKTE